VGANIHFLLKLYQILFHFNQIFNYSSYQDITTIK